jgi:hypothetical protein
LATNASTSYRTALKTALNYQSDTYTLGLAYSRIAPGYKTLGGYYFLNDLETYGLKGSSQLMAKQLAFSGDLAIEQDNLDGAKAQTARRLVLALNANYTPSQKLNLTLSFSNFSSFSNFNPEFQYLARTTQLSGLDTLNYRQINYNLQGSLFYELPSSTPTLKRSLTASGFVQSGREQQQSLGLGNSLVNVSLMGSQANQLSKVSFAGGLNITKTHTGLVDNLMIGPIGNFASTYLNDQLSVMANVGYVYARSNSTLFETQQSGIFTCRLGLSYKAFKQGNLQANVTLLNKHSPGLGGYSANFTESIFSLGYHQDFSLLDLKFK